MKTTITDEFGSIEPAAGDSLRCVDQGGGIVKEDPVGYGILWVGIFAVIGLIVWAVLSFRFAASLGLVLGRSCNRSQKSNLAANTGSV